MNFWIFVFLMFLATYSTRVIPALFIGKIHFSRKAKTFLQLIPYTSMTALVFPAVLSCDPDNLWIGLIGAATAFAAAWNRLPVVVSVLLAVLADLALYLFIF